MQVRLVHPDKLQMDTEAEKLKTQQAFRGIYMRSKFSFAVCTCVEKNLATDNLQMDTEAEKLKTQQAFRIYLQQALRIYLLHMKGLHVY